MVELDIQIHRRMDGRYNLAVVKTLDGEMLVSEKGITRAWVNKLIDEAEQKTDGEKRDGVS